MSKNRKVVTTTFSVRVRKRPIDKEFFLHKGWNELTDLMSLSPRQSQIAKCLMMGLCDKQICKKLAMSPGTLRTQMKRMFHKTESGDRVEFILSAMQNYLCHFCEYTQNGCQKN